MTTIRERHKMLEGQEFYPSMHWDAVVQSQHTDMTTLLGLVDELVTTIEENHDDTIAILEQVREVVG